MRTPLALLLLLIALAHATSALYSEPLGGSPDNLWDRNIIVYERGEYNGKLIHHKNFFMAKKQCNAVIEKDNLLCQVKDRRQVDRYAPTWLRVETGKDYRAPNIHIRDRLDRVEIRRQPPCLDQVNVKLVTQCELL